VNDDIKKHENFVKVLFIKIMRLY